jgi:shikimate dehydrogenase
MSIPPLSRTELMKRFAVVGDPVAHSLSPLIHTGWLETFGLDAHYGRVHLQSEDAADAIRAMAHDFAGLNVTLPHKIAALEASAKVDGLARLVGAANTLVNEAGQWTAHNTDVAGFAAAVRAAVGEIGAGSRVILIGAGGAARAAAVSLHQAGAKITILNRSVANAEKLAAELAPGAQVDSLESLTRHAESADLIVNSASLGHAGVGLPALPKGAGRPFLDLSYGKAADAVLAPAKAAGWTPHDGLTMLVAQAAAAFRLWFGIDPDQAEALAACRKAVAARA